MAFITVSGNVGMSRFTYTSEGVPVLSVSVADRRYNPQSQEEETVWVRAVMFGERAEKQANGLTKAKIVSIFGKEDYKIYNNQIDRQIIPIDINILAFKRDTNNEPQIYPRHGGNDGSSPDTNHYPPINDNDIPFYK